MIQFAEIEYAPLLMQRNCELQAVSNLKPSERRLIFPIFRFRPWLNSSSLEKAINKLLSCAPEGHFACDIDDWWSFTDKNRDKETAIQFHEMRSQESGELWYDFIAQFSSVVPCIRLQSPIPTILKRIKQEWLIDRGYGFVLSTQNAAHHHKIFEILPHIDHNNYFVVIDVGWARDVLLSVASTSEIAAKIFNINPISTVFVSSSSFPDSFSDVGIDTAIPLSEFVFFDEVSRILSKQFNQSRVRYSDWGTTKPPFPGGGGWVPRIDFPNGDHVRVFRDKPNEEDEESSHDACVRLASLLTGEHDWPSAPPTWGHYLIDQTSAGAEGGIYNPQRNVASRINMHLHRTLYEKQPMTIPPPDEPFDG